MKFSNQISTYSYKYKTLSIDHLIELQNDIDKLFNTGKLSEHKTYRHYLSNKKFEVPENFPQARSLVILAISSKLAKVNFKMDGTIHDIIIPPNYYDDGLEYEDLENLILNDIIKESGHNVQLAQVHLKLLAVRCGLGRYGRNNICYVDEWGSYISLYAYFTDFEFKEDNWSELVMMDVCKTCEICINNCPTGAIPTSTNGDFVIDAGKCVSLYNEIPGEFPSWINPKAHGALIGCMKCQFECPANKNAFDNTTKLETVLEEETKMILEGKSEDFLLDSLCKKLKMFYPSNAKEFFPVLKRNLDVLIG
ncbi:MAG: 4Fe-4S double cluster binding domain-containing protein [Promethearchaeota archaeon]|jgi:epoxyqueuosine reductase